VFDKERINEYGKYLFFSSEKRPFSKKLVLYGYNEILQDPEALNQIKEHGIIIVE
jgi:hypothetical protein